MRLDAIVIVPYETSWSEAFERESRRLSGPLGPRLTRPIEHIGSTAVPGLAAKPIIDMLGVVGDLSLVGGVLGAIEELGWFVDPEPRDATDHRLSMCFPSVDRRSHHLHIVDEQSDDWRGWLAFRDYLCRRPDLATDYATLKQRLAADHGADPNQRDAYRAGKAEFIRNLTAAALAE